MNETLDALPANDPKPALKVQLKKYLLRILILTIINITLFSILPLDDSSVRERFSLSCQPYLVGFNVAGFLLGLLFALIPFRDLPYGKKYLHASILTISVLHIIVFIMVVLAAIPMLLSWIWPRR